MRTLLLPALLVLLTAACEPSEPCVPNVDCVTGPADPTAIIEDGKIIGYKGP